MQMADSAIATRSKYLDELMDSKIFPGQRGEEHITDAVELNLCFKMA